MTLIPAAAAILAVHHRLHVKVREESQVRVGERADYQAPVKEPVELLAACLGQQRAPVAGREVAGVRTLAVLACVHADRVC